MELQRSRSWWSESAKLGRNPTQVRTRFNEVAPGGASQPGGTLVNYDRASGFNEVAPGGASQPETRAAALRHAPASTKSLLVERVSLERELVA